MKSTNHSLVYGISLLVLSLGVTAESSALETENERPNVIIIMADDIGAEDWPVMEVTSIQHLTLIEWHLRVFVLKMPTQRRYAHPPV